MSRRRKYRRRRRFALLCLLLAALLIFVLFRGCGGQTQPAGVRDPGPQAAASSAAAPERPYAAVPPPPDAEPLARTAGEQPPLQYRLAESSRPEAGGYRPDAERSVPLGETLVAGAADPSDGPLKGHRIVAYYGSPLPEHAGLLARHEPEETMERLGEEAAAYSAADPERPAVPAVDLVVSAARRTPGTDGLYLDRLPPEQIEEYADLASRHGALLILDLQIGRSTVADEIEAVRPFLELPHVHLALDTEYAVGEGQVPGVNLGSMDRGEIQAAIELLDRLVEENDLPDKVLIVHQFAEGIIADKQRIRPTDNVQVVLNTDGVGTPAEKTIRYDLLVRQEPIQYGGIRIFRERDDPPLAPEEVLLLDPAPAVISYQ
ncbi:hypothetical protein E0L93_04075 [Rubrobacter taiwanensis]|jgi:hypothetical protein|uniref:Uncharacterized protein n=1 Tax=Rubrobacter taiwanensis TaxID=185139 RepID=A0A4R1BPW5_9ACTN|nr:hypothetical protein [Rubrobacter taiwanensis]TCJ19690.1 hypothetical protein E0L93_04075 [Rubrobacter taiwanensis]